MSDNRDRHAPNEVGDAYQAGYQAAADEGRTGLANALRTYIVSAGEHDGELISDQMARSIFTAVYGGVATDAELGPEPVGRFDTSELDDYRPEDDETL